MIGLGKYGSRGLILAAFSYGDRRTKLWFMKIKDRSTTLTCTLLLAVATAFGCVACSKAADAPGNAGATPANAAATPKPAESEAKKAEPAPAGKEIKVVDGPKLKSIEPTEGTILGGVLNSYATSMPQIDPAIAKAANASGTVTVEIVINEKGEVAASSVVSGPQELWRSAGNAARETKFDPPLHNGKPVKVAGVLTFEFTK